MPKERQLSSNTTSSTTKNSSQLKEKTPRIDSIMKPPTVPPGEDEASFKRHNKILILESKKSRPNIAVVTPLMERTFAFRRADILANPLDVTTMFTKYPFLQNVDQVSANYCTFIWFYNSHVLTVCFFCSFFLNCSVLCRVKTYNH